MFKGTLNSWYILSARAKTHSCTQGGWQVSKGKVPIRFYRQALIFLATTGI